LRHVSPGTSVAAARRVLFFPFRSRLGHVIVGFAEWTAGAAAGQPRVDTGSVESMATSQASDVIVVFECVDTDGAAVAGSAEHLRSGGGPDRIIVILLLCQRIAAILLVEGRRGICPFEGGRSLPVLVLASACCRRFLARRLDLRMIVPSNVECCSRRVSSFCARLLDASSTAGWSSHSANGWQSLGLARRSPCLVL
jgi:hypothetical protein